jgi:type VI secretion system Hcp family effector
MALEAYILVKGFEGTSKKAGHAKGSSIVHTVTHSVQTAVDTSHGVMTGRRNHTPIKVGLLIDASVYQYHQAIIDKDKDGSKRLEVELGFFRSDQTHVGLPGKGENAPYYKIQLKDAVVVGVDYYMGDTRGGTPAQPGQTPLRQEYIEVTFIYREIHWIYTDGNKETMDAWDK